MDEEQLKTNMKRHKQLWPVFLLSFFCLEAPVEVVLRNCSLSATNYLAMEVLAFNYLVYFLFPKFYKVTLTLTLVIGLFNIIEFSYGTTTVRASINGLIIYFQPQAFLAILLTYKINFKKINDFLFKKEGPEPSSEEAIKKDKVRFEEEVIRFKEKYESYSTATLLKILEGGKYVPEAMEAARLLLKERKELEEVY
ncbi:MAG: hypothetical protein CFE21_03445 [Bacteroidetes bacterium B1(2017)]|nr:MAG: hypothetical protein CFE21_03445 [Bacteroidetes bacterium B1(2017)]